MRTCAVRSKFRKVWVAGLVLVLTHAPSIAKGSVLSASEQATQMLESSGVKGGLVVHLGCGDGRLTAALRANDAYLVHGLDADARNVAEARNYIQSLGLYGKVSVEQWSGGRLPYIANLVNLLVSEKPMEVPMTEVLRVLVPDGVAYVKDDGKWVKTVKPRPADIDEWTHYLYDATGNAVGHDPTVGPPSRLQWVGSPRWARHHDRMASVSALVSAGGRIFYILDEGPHASILLPPKWCLIARDAFNGTILWRRQLSSWHTHLWPFKSGPAQLPRRLVAVGDRVYATLALEAPLTAIDAATGETVRIYKDTKATEEVIASDGVLFLLVNEAPAIQKEYLPLHRAIGEAKNRVAREWPWDEQKRSIVAVRAETGDVAWRKQYSVAPLTLAADRHRVYFHDGEKVVCLHRKNGEEVWSSSPVPRRSLIPTCFGPTLVVYQDVVLFSGGDRSQTALSVETGKTLWAAEHPRSGHNSPEDLLVVNGLVWAGEIAAGKDSGIFTGRDLLTGEIRSQFRPDVEIHFMHHRCYRSRATDRYLLPSRTGIEFVDFRSKHWTTHHWVRGGCLYGFMPCNGLIYAPPHSCACYVEAKLNGFCALASNSAAEPDPARGLDRGRLECGPAYQERAEELSASATNDDWPTYRHDAARSAFTKAAVPADLKSEWQADLSSRLSSLVVAGARVFVASVDAHAVHALDADSGEVLWSYTAGGRVDSPPTIYRGRVLFGSADGWVYCLRASDGELVWRFRAAPEDLRLAAFEQLESVWPVHGSVLVQDGVVHCVAGRSMFLDRGMRFLRLDAKTGRKVSETILDDRDPETGENLQVHVSGLNMPVALPDVLSSDGQTIYMRSQQFDLQGNRRQIAPTDIVSKGGQGVHLFSPTGFLDGSWWHRSYWVYGSGFAEGAGGWPLAGRYVPAGRLLVFDPSSVYGYGRKPEYFKWSTPLEYHLFAASKQPEIILRPRAQKAAAAQARKAPSQRPHYLWSQSVPLQVRGMILADKTLFIAGVRDVVDEEQAFDRAGEAAIQAKVSEQAAALEGRRGALLWAVSASNAKKLAEYDLESPPVWDGMAAAGSRLYLATQNGKVVCFRGK